MEITPQRASNRGSRVLNKLVANKLATESAVQSALNLVNPFPDDSTIPSGWPDGAAFPTVPVVYKSEIPLTAPAGLPAGATWDAHIMVRPFMIASTAAWSSANLTQDLGMITGNLAGTATASMFQVATSQSGLLPIPDTNAWNTAQVVTATPEGVFRNGAAVPFRICALGVEAVNTSAALYRGGMGYAYRTPSVSFPVFQTSLSTTNVFNQSATIITPPPTTPADIINLANTYSGSAEAGVVYVGSPQNFAENDFTYPYPSLVTYVYNYGGGVTPYNIRQVSTLMAPAKWDNGGIFLTGLAQNSSFTLKFRCYGEIASVPLSGNATWQALAQPSVPYSPSLIQILTEMGEYLPAGFDYRENPFGEWFTRVLNVIAEVAPPVAAALGAVHPVAGMIAHGVGQGAKALSGVTQSTAKKVAAAKKKQKTANPAGTKPSASGARPPSKQ